MIKIELAASKRNWYEHPEGFFLVFPYDERKREIVKKHGGRWDTLNKAWFVKSLRGSLLQEMGDEIELGDTFATWLVAHRDKVSNGNAFLLDLAREMIAEDMGVGIDEVDAIVDGAVKHEKKMAAARKEGK